MNYRAVLLSLSPLCLIWFGIVIGISVIEAPAKFSAPSLTREVALDVGNHGTRGRGGGPQARARPETAREIRHGICLAVSSAVFIYSLLFGTGAVLFGELRHLLTWAAIAVVSASIAFACYRQSRAGF